MEKRLMVIIAAVILWMSVLTTGCTSQPDHALQGEEKPVLRIGYLPITHAALPLLIEYQHDGELENFKLEMVRFSNWAELAEAVQAGKIDGGGDILNNLAIKITANGVPMQAVLMAVRDGSVLMVANDIQDASQLKGKIIAVPSRFSPHYILLYQYLIDHGLDPEADVEMPEMAPPDMVQALASGSIDGYIVAEPFGAQAEELGVGRVLALSSEMEIPDARSAECSISIRKDFIDEHPEAVQEFVEELIKTGMWMEDNPQEAADTLAPILGQKSETIFHAINQPEGRSGYLDLYPRVSEFTALQDYMFELGLLEEKIDIEAFVEERFAEKAYQELGLTRQDE